MRWRRKIIEKHGRRARIPVHEEGVVDAHPEEVAHPLLQGLAGAMKALDSTSLFSLGWVSIHGITPGAHSNQIWAWPCWDVCMDLIEKMNDDEMGMALG